MVPITFEDPVLARLLQAELGKETIFPSDLVGFSGMQIAADEYLFLSGQGRPGKNVILHGQDTFEHESRRYTGYGTIKMLMYLKHFPDLTALRITLQPQLGYGTIPILDRLIQLNITYSKLTSPFYPQSRNWSGLILLAPSDFLYRDRRRGRQLSLGGSPTVCASQNY